MGKQLMPLMTQVCATVFVEGSMPYIYASVRDDHMHLIESTRQAFAFHQHSTRPSHLSLHSNHPTGVHEELPAGAKCVLVNHVRHRDQQL